MNLINLFQLIGVCSRSEGFFLLQNLIKHPNFRLQNGNATHIRILNFVFLFLLIYMRSITESILMK